MFAACGTIALGNEQPPDIVLIVADDLGWGDVGFNGRTEWSTPNLDRLAGQGVVLKRCYSAATVCAPSRAAFLTGKYTIHSGVRRNDEDLPAEEVTIAEALRSHGYATALFGKWHHGKPRGGRALPVHPMDQGFDEFFGYTDATKAWEKYPKTLWDGAGRSRSQDTSTICSPTERSNSSAVGRRSPSFWKSPMSQAISTLPRRLKKSRDTGASSGNPTPLGPFRQPTQPWSPGWTGTSVG